MEMPEVYPPSTRSPAATVKLASMNTEGREVSSSSKKKPRLERSNCIAHSTSILLHQRGKTMSCFCFLPSSTTVTPRSARRHIGARHYRHFCGGYGVCFSRRNRSNRVGRRYTRKWWNHYRQLNERDESSCLFVLILLCDMSVYRLRSWHVTSWVISLIIYTMYLSIRGAPTKALSKTKNCSMAFSSKFHLCEISLVNI